MSSVAVATERPIVYLPGLDGTGKLLFTQERLLREYHVVCQSYPNQPGHTYQSLAEDAAVTIRRDLDGRPVTVLAESFGGGVAIEFALSYPELLERLILVNTFAKYPVGWLVKLGGILSPLAPGRPSPPWTRALRNRFLFADDLPRPTRDRWWEQTASLNVSAAAHRVKLIAGLDRREDLAQIEAKTMVVVSTDDRLVSPKAGYELAAKIPDAKLIEVTGGHTILSYPTFDLCEHLDAWQ